jgi:hypothetical protein
VPGSVGTNPGIESGGFDSFGDFCGRVRRLDSKVKESIRNRRNSQTKAGRKILLILKKTKTSILNLILSPLQPF